MSEQKVKSVISGAKCPSCGKEYHNHLGLIGTCKQLQELQIENEQLKEFCIWMTGYREENEKLRSIVKELLESAAYWSEYDVPIGIVERMKEALEITEE